MPLTQYMMKNILDWQLVGGGAQPPGRWISWATQSPRTDSAFDGPFTTRNTATFAAANSPAGTVTNLNAMTGPLASAAATVVGWNLWDRSVGGTRLAFGTLTASLGCKSNNDNPAVAAGALKITLS